MSKIYVDEIAGIASADTVAIPGHVIQVVSTTVTSFGQLSSTSFTDVPDLTVSITPSSASSKILVTVGMTASAKSADLNAVARLNRNGSAVAVGDVNGDRTQGSFGIDLNTMEISPHAHPLTFLDSPNTTSSLTYKMQVKINGGSGLVVFNRSLDASNSASRSTAISTITLMEIAG